MPQSVTVGAGVVNLQFDNGAFVSIRQGDDNLADVVVFAPGFRSDMVMYLKLEQLIQVLYQIQNPRSRYA